MTAAGATAPLLPMLLAQTRSELRMRWRVAAFSLTSLLLPIVFFTFFGLPFVRQTFPNGVSVGAYLLASFAAYAVGNVMVYGFGIGVAVERGQKVDLLLRATPLPPAIAITAKVLNALIFSLLSITALIVYGVVVGGLHQNLAVWVNVIVRLLAGSLPFVGLGFAIGYSVGPQRRPGRRQPRLPAARLRFRPLHAGESAARLRAEDGPVPAHVSLRAARVERGGRAGRAAVDQPRVAGRLYRRLHGHRAPGVPARGVAEVRVTWRAP